MEVTADPILVTIFLRGACDGLNIVPPLVGEDRAIYEAARPNLKMPLSGSDALLPLDDRFGIHPAAKPLHDLFRAKKLAVIHSCGLPTDTRSHFDAQAMMELGTPGKKGTRNGWLTRVSQFKHLAPKGNGFSLPTVSVGPLAPTSFLDEPNAAVINNPAQMNITGNKNIQAAQCGALAAMYGGSDWLLESGERALNAIQGLQAGVDQLGKDSSNYGNNEIGNRLHALSQLIRLNIGVRIAATDMGGWDTHRYQGAGNDGRLAGQVKQLSQALEVFMNEMADRPVTVVVMSEFGRRLKENANRGTDHGHGNIMMVMGAGVKGGKVYGDWRGLRTENLYDRADLAVTTDYRQVLSELLLRRFGVKRVDGIFPGFHSTRSLGVF